MTTPFTRNLRIHGKTPRFAHTFQSYPYQVRDAMLDRIKAMPEFTGFTFRSINAFQVQPENVPFCAVYFLEEKGVPDGDPNAGEVRFWTSVRYGISVIIQNNNSDQADLKLDRFCQTLTEKLFTDRTLYDGDFTGDAKIRSFTSLTRIHVFGNLIKDQETPTAELRLELTCDLGAITYEPQIVDDFETVRETTIPPGGDINSPAIISVYEVD